MGSWKNDVRYCKEPEIVNGRLTAIRNIHLRQELSTISNQIQARYKERLPALQLVAIAAYEQVFIRRPLSLPEELRRDAIKYALQYYQLNIDKLRIAEVQNGLCPNHDRLSCFDKKCPLHHFNTIVSSEETHTDDHQSNISDSDRSTRSWTSDNTHAFNTTDTDRSSTSISTNKESVSSVSSFSDTNISYSSIDTSNPTSLISSSTDQFSKGESNRSTTTHKTDQQSTWVKKPSHRIPPKIIIRRPSDSTTPSIIVNDKKKKSVKKHSKHVHHQLSDKRTKRRKNSKKH